MRGPELDRLSGSQADIDLDQPWLPIIPGVPMLLTSSTRPVTHPLGSAGGGRAIMTPMLIVPIPTTTEIA